VKLPRSLDHSKITIAFMVGVALLVWGIFIWRANASASGRSLLLEQSLGNCASCRGFVQSLYVVALAYELLDGFEVLVLSFGHSARVLESLGESDGD
jgi:hypothetical protein